MLVNTEPHTKRKEKEMNNKDIQILVRGDLWYIGFTIEGEIRVLPIRKRWFGRKWTPKNCPDYLTFFTKKKHFHFVNWKEKCLTMDNVREVFVAQYPRIEDFLDRINRGEKIEPMNYFDTRWVLRNLKGACGQCNTSFTDMNPNAGGGQCRHCVARSC